MVRSCRHIAVLVGVVLALTGLVGTATVATAPPAAAAPAAPSVKLAVGDRSLTVAWGAVSEATGYTVQYGTSSTLARYNSVNAGTKTHVLIPGLTNGTTSYARGVAAVGSSRSMSQIVSAVPDDGYPRALTVTAVPAGQHAIRVSWTGQGRATKVGVIAGSEGGITHHVFRSAWHPATTTSITVTVPPEFRAQLGTGSANPIFVKVATYKTGRLPGRPAPRAHRCQCPHGARRHAAVPPAGRRPGRRPSRNPLPQLRWTVARTTGNQARARQGSSRPSTSAAATAPAT